MQNSTPADTLWIWVIFAVIFFPFWIALTVQIGEWTYYLFMYLKKYSTPVIKQVNRTTKHLVVNNARRIHTQINKANTMVIHNYGEKNTINHLQKEPINDALLDALLQSTSTPSQSSKNDVINRRDRIHNDVFSVNRKELLDRIEKGQSITRIIKQVYGITGGESWTMYSIAIRSLAETYGLQLRHSKAQKQSEVIQKDKAVVQKDKNEPLSEPMIMPKTASSDRTDNVRSNLMRAIEKRNK